MKETFTEKYRPKEFDDVMGQDRHIEKFKAMVETGEIPHLLFYGPHGTGKTTCARIITEKIGAEVLFLNASDERGIDVIRYKVKNFMSTLSTENRPKIAIFDESDQLTEAAQEMLRAMMEQYESYCRIIFLCNHPERLTREIKSRCSIYEFRPIPEEDAKKFLENVISKESIKITPQAVTAIIEKAGGDLRAVLRILQDLSILDRKITIKDVREQYENLESFFEFLVNTLKDHDLKRAIKHTHTYFKKTGIDKRRFLEMLEGYIIQLDTFPFNWLIYIAEADIRITMGGTDIVQIDGMLAKMVGG